MRIPMWSAWLPAAVGLVACSGGGGATGPDAGQTGRLLDGGLAGPPGTPGSSWGPGSSELAVKMQNIGRRGETLLLTVQGSDPAAQTSEVHVALLDASNRPAIAFDTDWDGVADSAEQRIHFDQSTLGQKTFTQTITLPGLYALNSSIASAVLSLSDANGKLSPSVTAQLLPQTVDDLGAACDPSEVADRCAPGLGCGGKPPTCLAGVAPSLTTVAYFGGAAPTQLFVGNDPDEDLVAVTVSFLDAAGKSLSINLNGVNDFASSIVLDTTSATGTQFFYESDPTTRFVSLVPKISATPTDSFGRSGAPVVATLSNQPVRVSGQTCDPQGFTACATGFVCSPGQVGATNTCGGLARLQSDKCKAAPPSVIGGVLAGWGLVRGASLWDPPAGCAVGTAVGRPESILTLKLDHAVSTLTVSTATPETNFDTILYVLPACAASSKDALGCNDNAQGYTSTVKLTDVAAGTYLVVVDSADARGGQFGLSLTAQ